MCGSPEDLAMALLGIRPREIKISSYKNLYISVQSSSIHNKLNLGIQMFFSEWMVKQTMASSYHEGLVINKSGYRRKIGRISRDLAENGKRQASKVTYVESTLEIIFKQIQNIES